MASLEFGFDRLLVDLGPAYMEVGEVTRLGGVTRLSI